jgi:hypothetical protein
MARIEKPAAYRVDIIEYERGWGSKVDEVLYFDNKPEAVKYCEDFNARNYDDEVPDWYMIAEYRGRI